MATISQPEIAPQTPIAESASRRDSASVDRDQIAIERAHDDTTKPPKWSMGVLNDPYTHEVPGTFGFPVQENGY